MIAIEESTTVLTNGSVVLRHPGLKAGEQVKVIVLLSGNGTHQTSSPLVPGSKLRQNWAGGLSDLAGEYTSGQLQHKAS
jgi:hypothetical protein